MSHATVVTSSMNMTSDVAHVIVMTSYMVIVKNKTYWTPMAHIKVMFSLFLEIKGKQYESFEYFLPGVG